MAILAEGTIPVTQAVIFRPGTDPGTDIINFERLNITKITMFNKILTQQTIILFVRRKFGVFRKLRQYQLKLNESAEYLQAGEVLPLRPGDDLQAETTTVGAVDFVVYGDIA